MHIVIHKSEPSLLLQLPLMSKQSHGFAVIKSFNQSVITIIDVVMFKLFDGYECE